MAFLKPGSIKALDRPTSIPQSEASHFYDSTHPQAGDRKSLIGGCVNTSPHGFQNWLIKSTWNIGRSFAPPGITTTTQDRCRLVPTATPDVQRAGYWK